MKKIFIISLLIGICLLVFIYGTHKMKETIFIAIIVISLVAAAISQDKEKNEKKNQMIYF